MTPAGPSPAPSSTVGLGQILHPVTVSDWSSDTVSDTISPVTSTNDQQDRHPDRTREARLRRVAHRRGFKLQRTRRVDKLAVDYGTYKLLTADGQVVMDRVGLDEIEQQLEGKGE